VLECQGTRQQVGYFPTLAQGKPCDSQVSFAQAHQSMQSVRATQDKIAASLWCKLAAWDAEQLIGART